MMFMEEEEYLKELKKIGKKINEFLDDVNPRLEKMNAGFGVDARAIMHGFDWEEWPIDDLPRLVEEFVSAKEILEIPVAGLEGVLAVLYYREREEKKRKQRNNSI